ncbi:hypothetical protein [Opitutus sp. ER46]|uniref:LolA family protein n=1 Tax=Opitutus sp. ER46 TaxID=2161864 RepID=UPI0011B1EA8D|nr:hypothetical protein [Opitutus sp. ER46]
MNLRISRMLVAAVLMLTAVGPLRAGRAEELIRIHVEALGGRERIAALTAIRATGTVVVGDKRTRFTMLAARPNRVRIETENAGRTLIQVSDGVNAPWEFDTGDWPPRYRDMAKGTAATFAADAEFDDPLIAGAERGFTFDYAGEVKAENRTLLRILVTRRLTETFSLLLDPDTFFIVSRLEERTTPSGGKTTVVTHFADYRPVNGVLMPHLIALVIDGKPRQQTMVESIQPNPELPADAFARPVGIKLPKR